MTTLALGMRLLVVAGIVCATVGVGVAYHREIGSAVGTFLNRRPSTSQQSGQLYTCSMHPQVIREGPGSCPICGMPLEIAHAHNGANGSVLIDPVVVQNMAVRVAPVTRGLITSTLRATGSLVEEEPNHFEISLRVSGWIQKLYASKDGMVIAKGDPLFDLFSPELTLASDELIAARKAVETTDLDPIVKDSAETIFSAARRKLSLWGLSDSQIDAIAKLDKAPPTITFTSPIDGHISEKAVVEGAAVKAGDKILRISDRSAMWLELQVYEPQLRRLKVGSPVHVTVAAVPGTIDGKIDFIYPHLDMTARTAKVRVVLANEGHVLREGMYAEADIDTPPGEAVLMVPREAVIDTGVRQVVFIAEPQGHFTPRVVTIGATGHRVMEAGAPLTGENMIAILAGLTGDETVVTSGQFLIDSESRMQESLQKYIGDRELLAKHSAAPAAPSDKNFDTLVKSYLDLITFFSKSNDPAPASHAAAVVDAATALETSASDASIKALAHDAMTHAAAITGAPIDTQRQKLKQLSTSLIALLDKVPPSPGVLPVIYEFHCPMSKGDWVQTTNVLVNPYLPDMRDCGLLTKTIGKPDGVSK